MDVSSLMPWWMQRGWNVRRPAGQEVGAGGSRWAVPVGALEGTGGVRNMAGSPLWPHRDLGTVADAAADGPFSRSSLKFKDIVSKKTTSDSHETCFIDVQIGHLGGKP